MKLWFFNAVQVLADGATPSPSPTIEKEMTTATVTPGLPGFFVFFVMALALVFLALDMSRRIRRATARAAVEERMQVREAELAAEATGAGVASEKNDA